MPKTPLPPSDLPAALGDALRRRREAVGLSREAVAVAIGRSGASIRLYETAKVCPPLAVVHQLSVVLRCSVADLLEDRS